MINELTSMSDAHYVYYKRRPASVRPARSALRRLQFKRLFRNPARQCHYRAPRPCLPVRRREAHKTRSIMYAPSFYFLRQCGLYGGVGDGFGSPYTGIKVTSARNFSAFSASTPEVCTAENNTKKFEQFLISRFFKIDGIKFKNHLSSYQKSWIFLAAIH